VRSYTDYSVYLAGNGTEGSGLEGLDLAFYRGRAKYHTRHDSIPHTEGGQRALWAMMEATRDTGRTLLNNTKVERGRGQPAAYFDVLGKTTVSFRISYLLGFDIGLLIVGPLAIGALLIATVTRARKAREAAGRPAVRSSAKDLVLVLLGWARFWIALGAAVLSLFVLSTLYTNLNPFVSIRLQLYVNYTNHSPQVVHSHSTLVLVSTLSISYLAIVLPLSVKHLPFVHVAAPGSDRQRKLATLLESYALVWILLLIGTVATGRLQVGGTYFLTAWNLALLLGTLVALAEAWIRAGGAKGRSDLGAVEHRDGHGVSEGEQQRYLVRGVRYEAGGTDTGARDVEGEEIRVDGVVETEPTEITPLIAQQERNRSPSVHANGSDAEGAEKDEVLWWMFQMLLVVPLPVLLVSQLGTLLMAASGQTLVDGNSPVSGKLFSICMQ
jgi:hypothetical protein